MSATYKVAVIGTGFAKDVQIPAFQRHPRFNVVAIAARDPMRTRDVAGKFGVERWHTDWREMVAEGGFDLLSVVTPPHLHCEMTLAGLAAGMHVLCEKPMALNAEEAQQMLDRARETGLTGMIDHEYRYLAARQRFGELIRDGYIGELCRLIVCFHQARHAVHPAHKWDWWSDFKCGGGLLGAVGSHYFDAMQHWFRRPRRVWGKLNVFVTEFPAPDGEGSRAVTADDSFLAVLDLGDGVEALFDFSVAAKGGIGSRVTALGSEGTLMIEDDKRVLGSRSGEELNVLYPTEPLPTDDEPWFLAFLYLLDDVAAGIDQNVSSSPNFEDGLAHQEFIDAVKISNAVGTWVDYPPSGPAPGSALPTSKRSI
jgi:predicted dehydrogenase